jgi:transposase
MVVFMDNARIHKSHKTADTIQKLNMKVFTLIPYTPEHNMIEHLFGRTKNRLSRMNHNGKTLESLITSILSEKD